MCCFVRVKILSADVTWEKFFWVNGEAILLWIRENFRASRPRQFAVVTPRLQAYSARWSDFHFHATLNAFSRDVASNFAKRLVMLKLKLSRRLSRPLAMGCHGQDLNPGVIQPLQTWPHLSGRPSYENADNCTRSGNKNRISALHFHGEFVHSKSVGENLSPRC